MPVRIYPPLDFLVFMYITIGDYIPVCTDIT
nr:MAG TPA: hypothetical protein [Caudoviricetes sp.]